MKILFLSQIVPYPPHGGVLQRGYNIIREIARNNNDVYLLAFVHPDVLGTQEKVEESRKELLKICKSVDYFALWPKKSKFHKFIAFILAFFYPKPFSCLAHKSVGFKNKLVDIVEKEKIDLIHYDTIALAQYLDDSLDVPVVMTHHNIESHLMERRAQVESTPVRRYYASLQARRLREYEIGESKKFPVNIMVSDVDAAELSEMAPGVYTSVVPNGVDIQYYSKRDQGEMVALIYTGGMNMYANKDAVFYFLDEIWESIKAAVPEVEFYAIGQDPPKELIARAKQDTKIHVTGYVDDVRPYVGKASVYIVPLRVGGGTRLKVLDALAQGKAIVSTSVGCEGIKVSAGVNIEIADQADEFSQKVIALINDKDRRNRLGLAARQLAEEIYSWEVIGKDLNSIYTDLVQRHGKSQ